MTEPVYCFACNMTFRVEPPPSKSTERLGCSECGRAFWQSKIITVNGGDASRVGVWPGPKDEPE